MISIVIPAYNNPEQLKKLLGSICQQAKVDPGLEVIVVDDASKGDSIKKVALESGFASYIRMEVNRGPAAARNAGAAKAKNNLLLFLDSDVILNNDCLPRIKDRFKKDGSLMALCGEYDIEPVDNAFMPKFKALMARSWIPEGDSMTVFVARLGAIKKNVFMELGGFDTGIRTASTEEWELGRRLMAKGITIGYDPAITARHHFPSSFIKQMKLFFHRSFMWIYVFKTHGRFDNTCTTPLLAISQICGTLTLFFLAASLIKFESVYLSAVTLIFFLLTSLRFFKLAFRREGLFFTLKSLLPALVLSVSVVMGAAWGIIYYSFISPVKKKRRAR